LALDARSSAFALEVPASTLPVLDGVRDDSQSFQLQRLA